MQRHKPPSRIRYEKGHPTVSFRLERELKERLEEVLEGRSFASFVKEALGVREREKKSLEEARVEGYRKGYEKGYGDAKVKFLVYTTCAICGGALPIVHPEDKKRLYDFMSARGWCHASCMGGYER